MKSLKVWALTGFMTLSAQIMAADQSLDDIIDQVQEVSTTTLTDGRKILTDENGLTLYLFDADTPGVSNCSGQCEVIWPVLTTQESQLPEPFSIHIREDGSQQIVFNESPLYYFISDKNEGDIFGDGLNGVWHIFEITE